MITSGIYNYVNILDKAADAANFRNELISNNIANVDTPNYKRKDIDFESVLQAELAGEKTLYQAVKSANNDLSTLDPQVYTDNSSLSYRLDEIANADLSELTATTFVDYANVDYRLDGNNVDIATEEAYLAENQIRYQALVDMMNQEFSRYKSVMSSSS